MRWGFSVYGLFILVVGSADGYLRMGLRLEMRIWKVQWGKGFGKYGLDKRGGRELEEFQKGRRGLSGRLQRGCWEKEFVGDFDEKVLVGGGDIVIMNEDNLFKKVLVKVKRQGDI